MQKQFIADASHELKTPLAIISANLSAMKAKPEDFEKFNTYTDIQVGRMSGLINHLLTLAKQDTLTLSRQNQLINLSQIVETAYLEMEVLAYERGLAITSVVEADLWIMGDQDKINQVLAILFDNAIKYASPNSKEISMALRSQAKLVLFEISNTVENVKELEPEKLFNRFYRADEARVHTVGSYGLGLSIAKAIINELSGKVSAELNEDQITFAITLQRKK